MRLHASGICNMLACRTLSAGHAPALKPTDPWPPKLPHCPRPLRRRREGSVPGRARRAHPRAARAPRPDAQGPREGGRRLGAAPRQRRDGRRQRVDPVPAPARAGARLLARRAGRRRDRQLARVADDSRDPARPQRGRAGAGARRAGGDVRRAGQPRGAAPAHRADRPARRRQEHARAACSPSSWACRSSS